MSREKLLLVDDSPIVLTFHKRILEQAGFIIKTAVNGYDAFEMAMTESFDMIITDINMPKMDGYVLARKLRTVSEYQDIPILMVSTEAESNDVAQAMEAGANSYLFKPVQPSALLTQVEMHFAGRRKSAG